MTGQYYLFCSDRYYLSGGWKDYQGRYETLELAHDHAKIWLNHGAMVASWEYSHYHIVDSSIGEVIFDNEYTWDEVA